MRNKKENKSNVINVYWAPHSVSDDSTVTEFVGNWNMLYEDPYNVFKHWSQFDLKGQHRSFIACPAFKNLSKNIYAWNWPIDCSYVYDSDNGSVEGTSINYIGAKWPRTQTMSVGPSIEMSFRLHMLADQPVEIQITGPYLQQAEYQKYGFLTSGQFDTGQWFRTINVEIQTYKNKGELHFKGGEPIFYINFLTDKKINFHRFELTSEIDTYSRRCVENATMFGSGTPLPKLYNIFNKTRTKEILMKKIKQQVL